jgi:hypothetical protein
MFQEGSIPFMRRRVMLLLWQYAAEPDAWLYMEFEKSGA